MIILLILMLFAPVGAKADTQHVSIQELFDPSYTQPVGQTVRVRGFYYTNQEQLHILSADPGLKSCCVGSASKKGTQLVVNGELEDADLFGKAVVIEGVLGKQGDQLVLDQAQVVESRSFPWWTIVFVGIVLVTVGIRSKIVNS